MGEKKKIAKYGLKEKKNHCSLKLLLGSLY